MCTVHVCRLYMHKLSMRCVFSIQLLASVQRRMADMPDMPSSQFFGISFDPQAFQHEDIREQGGVAKPCGKIKLSDQKDLCSLLGRVPHLRDPVLCRLEAGCRSS